MIIVLEPEVEALSQELQKAFVNFDRALISWKDIHAYLEFSEDDQQLHEAFTVPEELPGWSRVAKKNKKVEENYLYDRWKAGNDAGVFAKSASQAFPKVWKIPVSARARLVEKWTRSLFEERIEMIQELYKKYSAVQEKLIGLRSEQKIETLRKMRVIGCTTTAAAMYNKLIRGANPDVVLVEEAGEILESHILTALTPSVKQLILIGDDKQLRPKANNYALTAYISSRTRS
jgi:hypothetical protein